MASLTVNIFYNSKTIKFADLQILIYKININSFKAILIPLMLIFANNGLQTLHLYL